MSLLLLLILGMALIQVNGSQAFPTPLKLAAEDDVPDEDIAALKEYSRLIAAGTLQYQQGQWSNALATFRRANAIAHKLGNAFLEAVSFYLMGSVYDSLANYPEALESLGRAWVLAQKIDSDFQKAGVLNNIAAIYFNLGQEAKALQIYQQALEIARRSGDRDGEFLTLSNIAVLSSGLGQLDRSLSTLQQLLALARAKGNRDAEATVLNNLGTIYFNQRQIERSRLVWQQALALAQAIGNRASIGITIQNLGHLYAARNQPAKALEAARQAVEIFHRLGDRADWASALEDMGAWYLLAKQYAAAERSLLNAMQLQETLRPGLSDENKVSLSDTQRGTYQLLQLALIAQHKTDAALEVAERGRARTFADMIARRLVDSSRTQPTVAAPRLDQIRRIAQTQNATLVEYSILYNRRLSVWVVKPTGEIIFRQIDIKALQPAQTAAIQTTESTIVAARGAGQHSMLTSLVDRTRTTLRGVSSIATRSTGPRGTISLAFEADPSKVHRQLKQLHQLLIHPIADLLPTDATAHVIFIPQASLFLVPFAALQAPDGKYLIEQHTILTAPSIQVLDLTRQLKMRTARGGRVQNPLHSSLTPFLIVGNPQPMPKNLPPLPGAEREAVEVARLFDARALLRTQATKAAVVAQMPHARTILLATHGEADDKQGLQSWIAFAPSGEGDSGLLTAGEILNLKLQAELVVLSACKTGQGSLTGDGVIGLSRSFIAAGASSILVSLWSVDDASTALLMETFYRNLQQHPDKAQALRQAILTTKQEFANPVFWAAFTLIGESN